MITMVESTSKIWSVSEINRLVKDVLEQSFYPFWVGGEVSNLTIHRSGHVYFTLKDAHSQVQAVFFRGGPAATQMGLRDGLLVEAHGRLGVYEPRGQYQLVVTGLRPQGQGDLQRRFEELKAKLRAEGLFDDERKRPLPALPSRIGVVTSPSGAALRDFLSVLSRRFANLHVRIYPASVQGATAAREVAAGVDYFNRAGDIEVIVVTRGGGSLEDLWPFNEEVVVRAIGRSAIPVVSGVGHEVDVTLCDLVADLRVPTPSAAAELVVRGQGEWLERVGNLRRRLGAALGLELARRRRRLDRVANHAVFRETGGVVRMYQQRVDEAGYRLERACRRKLQLQAARLDRAGSSLSALNPRAVLERGYAILLAADGQAVHDSGQVHRGQALQALLGNGQLGVEVTQIVLPSQTSLQPEG